jgi:RNA-directed DNA polymerase
MVVCGALGHRPHREPQGETPVTNDRGKSDSSIVPGKPPNRAEEPAAEEVEGRGLAEGNSFEQNASRTLSRRSAPSALAGVRQAAQRERQQRFTALLHHVYDKDRLRGAYYALKRDAAAGVDGETWQHYGERLEENLQDLSGRLARGAYRARPVLRRFIPKADGRQRPLGVPALEDKIVQRAIVEVLNAIYEVDFLGFSYGFRPGRSPHLALDALATGIHQRSVNWVLDADIRSFFDALDHGWLVKFVEHRIADQRVVRLIQKWLKAGVLEDGKRTPSELGTVQGGSVSPLLANVYLHYAFDLWIQWWREKRARGDVVVVRFADDFVVGFEHREEAERFLEELRARLARFGLELHPDKTRLIPFGRKAQKDWHDGRGPKPDIFHFLGFTHSSGKTRRGKFIVLRQTMRKRVQAKLTELKQELRRRMHQTIPEQGAYLRSVVMGHVRYFGVPLNGWALVAFRSAVGRLWLWTLRRRSQKHRLTMERFLRYTDRWLPPARVCHPYPWARFGVITQGRSPVR